MNTVAKVLVTIGILVLWSPAMLLTSCSESDNSMVMVNVEVSDIDSACNAALFQGVKPGIAYSELRDIMGEYNDLEAIVGDIVYEDEDYTGYDVDWVPVYYLNDAKLRCYGEQDTISYVVWVSYMNKTYMLDYFFKLEPDRYGINSETRNVSIKGNDARCFSIWLDKLEITGIYYYYRKEPKKKQSWFSKLIKWIDDET